MPMNGRRERFETEPCRRCGGSGWYSWCQTWGRTCFACGVTPHAQGLGRHLTKRGAAAYDFYLSLLPTRRAADLQAGDVVLEHMTHGKPRRVLGVRPTTGALIDPDGTRRSAGFVDVSLAGVTLVLVSENTTLSVVPSDEERERYIARAIEYQDSLTKTGKVRKRASRKAA